MEKGRIEGEVLEEEKQKERVDRGPTLSFLLALNFFRHSTVSCLCIMEATVERCCRWRAPGRERRREPTSAEIMEGGTGVVLY